MEALRGALRAGADAVYLAGKSFGARAYADNFSPEELREALRLAHVLGRKVYLTANVLTRERELPELLKMISDLYDEGLDGVIVQDLGAAAALHRAFPGLLLHASTQMSVTGPEAVTFLQRMGFSRVVPARELSLREILVLKETGTEIETFIHGAMCYSCSGRCLMSGFLGGRSGNRGRCAGTCRLPYDVYDEKKRRLKLLNASDSDGRDLPGRTYPLSMKDLCALQILPELIDAGIDSFKIEGRMKKAEYAAGVTAVYRRCIDRFYDWDAKGRPGAWTAESGEMDELRGLYIRTDLSTGYCHERNGRDMVTIGKPGYLGASEELLVRIRRDYLAEDPVRPIRGTARIMAGEPAVLGVRTMDPAVSFCAEGAIAQEAQSRPLTNGGIREKLRKTGGTPFAFASLDVVTDGKSFLPVSSLNELRRRALEGLQEAILSDYDSAAGHAQQPSGERSEGTGSEGTFSEKMISDGNAASSAERKTGKGRADAGPITGFIKERPALIALVQTMEQAQAACRAGAEVLILDGEVREAPSGLMKGRGASQLIFAALPQILRETDRGWLGTYYAGYAGAVDGFLVRCLEELEFLNARGYCGRIITDSSLYCWNQSALEVLRSFSDYNVLPLELDRREMERTFAGNFSRMVLTAYGRAPMMVSANCVRKTAGRCPGPGRESGSWYGLRDRTGAFLPVRIDCAHCYNVIYNSVPTSLLSCIGDERDGLIRNVGGLLLAFTDETRQETADIVRAFRESLHAAACGTDHQSAESGTDHRGGDCARASRGAPHSSGGAHSSVLFPDNTTYGHYRKGIQ